MLPPIKPMNEDETSLSQNTIILVKCVKNTTMVPQLNMVTIAWGCETC